MPSCGWHRRESGLQIVLAYVVGHTMWSLSTVGAVAPPYEALDAKTFVRVREVAKKLGSYDPDREFTIGLDALVAGLAHASASRA